MNFEILLPFKVFASRMPVLNITVETPGGSFGLLPNRLDCIMPLVPGILRYVTAGNEEVYIAVDQGMLVKTGPDVVISVRHAIGGVDLGRLQEAVEKEFLNLDEREKSVRTALAKLESSFIRRYMELHHA